VTRQQIIDDAQQELPPTRRDQVAATTRNLARSRVPATRLPTRAELAALREEVRAKNSRERELPSSGTGGREGAAK